MIAAGKITGVTPREITISVPYDPRYVTQQWDAVTVDLPDGRTISPDQRRKAYALMSEIADWAGMDAEEVKLTHKHDFIQKHLEGLHRELFSLSNCDMTTARQFISYLIDFVLEFDVPLRVPLVTLCDDISKAVYSCLMKHKCIICGKPCDLHHVDRVGMGSDRNDICHIGMECLPLCREHHREAHDHGDARLMDLYHLETVVIDQRIAKEYKLGKRRKDHE